MFDLVLSIGGKSFLPVDVNIAPPMPAPIPEEIRNKLGDCDIDWFMPIHMDVENVSSESITNVRIKFPYKMLYTPVWSNRDKLREVEAFYDEDAAEITIDRLDPGDRFYIAVYPKNEHIDYFNEKNIHVLIEGKKVSKLQREVAFFIRKPLFGLSLLSILLVTVGVLMWSIYSVNPGLFSKESDGALIDRARARMGAYCTLEVIKVNSETWQSLSSGPFSIESILFINGSTSKNELLSRDKIITCVPVGS